MVVLLVICVFVNRFYSYRTWLHASEFSYTCRYIGMDKSNDSYELTTPFAPVNTTVLLVHKFELKSSVGTAHTSFL